MTSEKVANIAYNGLMKNKRVIIPGIMNKSMVYSMLFTPTWLGMKITAILEKPKR
jgi:short-subunit dehydrogenase